MADRVVMQAQNPNGDFVPVTSSVGPVDTTYMQRVLVFGMDANGAQHPIQCDANGNIGGGGGSGTPGGTSGSIQYNAAGAFGGSAAIIDAAGNFNNVGLSGNGFQITTTAPGVAPAIIAAGSDANIAINLTPKGTGTLYVNTATCFVATNCLLGLSNSTSYLQFGVGALTCGASTGVIFKAGSNAIGYAAGNGLAVWLTPSGTSSVVPANNANLDVSSIRAATSGANQNSGIQNFTGNFWNGAASANDYWSIQNVLGAGTNPTSTLNILHIGSTGVASVNVGPMPANALQAGAGLNIVGQAVVGGVVASSFPLVIVPNTTVASGYNLAGFFSSNAVAGGYFLGGIVATSTGFGFVSHYGANFATFDTTGVSFKGQGASAYVPMLTLSPSNNTGVTSECVYGLRINSETTTIVAGFANQRYNYTSQNSITAASALAITGYAATQYIQGPTIVTSSVTTPLSAALYVDSGAALGVGVTAGVGLVVNASLGATNNYAALFSGGNVGIGTLVPTAPLHVVGLAVYANNAAAITGGLTAGAFYRTGTDPDTVCVVH